MGPTDKASLNENLSGGEVAGFRGILSNVSLSFLINWGLSTKLTGKKTKPIC